jgi:hypothetical protein
VLPPAGPSRIEPGDIDGARALVASGAPAGLFLYPGDEHYVADSPALVPRRGHSAADDTGPGLPRGPRTEHSAPLPGTSILKSSAVVHGPMPPRPRASTRGAGRFPTRQQEDTPCGDELLARDRSSACWLASRSSPGAHPPHRRHPPRRRPRARPHRPRRAAPLQAMPPLPRSGSSRRRPCPPGSTSR